MSLLTKIKKFGYTIKNYTTTHQHQQIQIIGDNSSNCVQCGGSITIHNHSGGYQPTGTLNLPNPRDESGISKKPVEKVEMVIQNGGKENEGKNL